MLATAGTVLADTTETIDIGDIISETTYMADGWGPIQSGWGGNSGKFRVIWEPSAGAVASNLITASDAIYSPLTGNVVVSQVSEPLTPE